MLQFFKNPSRKGLIRSSSDNSNSDFHDNNQPTLNNGRSDHANPISFLEAESYCRNTKEVSTTELHHKLSKNIVDIVTEKNCLCYFVQFLETKQALPLIKFWLDAESYKTAALVCERSPRKSLKDVQTQHSKSFSSSDTATADSLSYLSIDCDDSLSLHSLADQKPLSDGRSESDTQSQDGLKSQSQSQSPRICDIRQESTSLPDLGVPKQRTNLYPSIATDAIRIYRKYMNTSSPYFVDMPATIVSNLSLALGWSDVMSDGTVSGHCFEEAQNFVLDKLEQDHVNQFVESTFYCKYTIDVLTDTNLTLADILHSEAALFYFMEFLEQENQRDLLDFWIAATNFKRHTDTSNRSEAQRDAMVLYEKYFSLQATNPLKMSEQIRFQVEESICSETEPISNCFDLALRIDEFYLKRNYFAAFVGSQLFYKYLSELFNRMGENGKKFDGLPATVNGRHRGHRKTHSDCSNDKVKGNSVRPKNTLLAMESMSKSTTADMQIDSQQLNNPDLLWRRNSIYGLSFGHVDSLGRYQRDYQLDPADERWTLAASGSKLRQAVRKLVNLPEDKVQEEIAWQVAEMIIKDITDVTLSGTTKT